MLISHRSEPFIQSIMSYQMQNRNYQNLQQEQAAQMVNYPQHIPVGQPVHQHNLPYHQPQPYPHQQQPQPQPFIHMPPPPPMLINNPQIGAQMYNFPVQLSCPCCKMNVPTVVNQESGNTTYTWCAAIGCCISPLFCCLPFVMDSCLDKAHYCPNCGHNILRKHQRCFEFIGC